MLNVKSLNMIKVKSDMGKNPMKGNENKQTNINNFRK